MARWYLTTRAVDSTGAFGPTGFDGLTGWQAMDYGREDVFLVRADPSPAEQTVLAATAGVFVCPEDLSTTLSAADVTTLQNQFATRRVPNAWISTATTYRQVLQAVAKYCFLMQRLVSGRTTVNVRAILDSTIEALTTGQKSVLQNVFGPLVDGPLPTTGPVKDAIRDLATDLPARVTSTLALLGLL